MRVRAQRSIANGRSELFRTVGLETTAKSHGAVDIAPRDANSPDEAFVAAPTPARLITRRQLREMIPYTSQHILRLEKKGNFPRRIQVGANRVAWLLHEIEAWIAARVAERDGTIR